MSSPTRPPRASRSASTAPRCRSGGPGPVAQGGGRSFPGRRNKHDQAHSGQRRPGAAAMARGDPPGPHARHHRAAHRGHRGPAAPPTPGSAPRSTPDTRAWPATFPGRSTPRPRSPGLMLRQTRPPAGNNAARPSPPSASASSMPSPNPSSGDPCSVTSDAGNTSKTPRWPSPDWYLTAAPGADDHEAGSSVPDARSPIVHLLVSRCAELAYRITHSGRPDGDGFSPVFSSTSGGGGARLT